ncbi:MAG: GIDE domain-containing protein, partial [Candidatus Nanohaloarchaea archaeon]|nr:GIDE domain-containing protein [Candidatus Nanohaloarchaea archaeon]
MERPGQTAADNEQNIVISRDDTTPLFLISDSSEKELRSDFGLWAYIFIIGGAIVAILSFIFIIGLLGF